MLISTHSVFSSLKQHNIKIPSQRPTCPGWGFNFRFFIVIYDEWPSSPRWLLTLWPCSTTQTHRPRLPLCTTISETEIRRPNDLYLFYMFLGDEVFLPALNFPSCLPFTWPCAAWLHRLCSRDTYRIRTHLRARQTHTLTHKSQKNKQEKKKQPKTIAAASAFMANSLFLRPSASSVTHSLIPCSFPSPRWSINWKLKLLFKLFQPASTDLISSLIALPGKRSLPQWWH